MGLRGALTAGLGKSHQQCWNCYQKQRPFHRGSCPPACTIVARMRPSFAPPSSKSSRAGPATATAPATAPAPATATATATATPTIRFFTLSTLSTPSRRFFIHPLRTPQPRLFSSKSATSTSNPDPRHSLPHDIGGNVHHFGGPIPKPEELQAWELKCHSLFAVLASKKIITTDALRRTIESLTPQQYDTWTYYERWTAAMTTLLLDQSIITHDELSFALFGDSIAKQQQGDDPDPPAPRFRPGDAVRVKARSEGVEWRRPHLRTPGYIYGVAGTIERVCGRHNDPSFAAFNLLASSSSSSSLSSSSSPSITPTVQLYRVQFRLQDLWPEQNHAPNDNNGENNLVEVEVYEHWLEASDTSTGHSYSDATNLFDHTHGDDCVMHHDHHDHDDHDHDDHHDHHDKHQNDHHRHDDDEHHHVHEPRPLVEARAVDREKGAGARPGQQLFQALLTLILKDKKLLTPHELRDMSQRLETAGQRLDGAALVVEAWTNPDFYQHLLRDAAAAAATLNISTSNPNAPTVLTVVPNTETTHNVVVCTLCSCYPSGLLGIAPSWYKSSEYRARTVREPRAVLEHEFGTAVGNGKTVRVHDSTADHRYLVLPERPRGTEEWTKEELRRLVTRDSMIGVEILPERVDPDKRPAARASE